MKSFGDLSGFFTPPAHGGKASSLVIIMHGWGADAADLADLAYPISLRFPGAAFFVPNAPDPCSANPMGRQWFEINDMVNGPQQAAGFIEASVAAACAELDLGIDAVALTGFSQGGMMSLHCGLHMQDSPAAIVSFSGALLQSATIPAHPRPPAVLLVHGTDDAVVPFDRMDAAAKVLAAKDIEVECFARPGVGHGIDPDALTRAIDFLSKHLPA
jgi:phospholipase/carboxylesterase